MASASPSRRVAHRVLVRVFDEGAYADRAFAGEAAELDARDRAFAQRLAYGATQRVRTLDHAIAAIGGRRPSDLDVPVRAALRLGAYELAFMDAVPPHATVSEAVELVRGAGAARATGLVNAVLRKAAGGIDELIDGLPETTAEEAALKHSYPDWVAQTWWREWGPTTRSGSCALRTSRPSTRCGLPEPEPGRKAAGRSWRAGPSGWRRASGCSISAPRRAGRRRSSPSGPSRSSPSSSIRAGRGSSRRTSGDSASRT